MNPIKPELAGSLAWDVQSTVSAIGDDSKKHKMVEWSGLGMKEKQTHSINRIVSIVLFTSDLRKTAPVTGVEGFFSAATITEATPCNPFFGQWFYSNSFSVFEPTSGFGEGTTTTETGLEENETCFLSVSTHAENNFATYLYSVA
ncbi:MAG: hypothetical protein ABFR33_03065 [Verrucomicrobiota bacterium]